MATLEMVLEAGSECAEVELTFVPVSSAYSDGHSSQNTPWAMQPRTDTISPVDPYLN